MNHRVMHFHCPGCSARIKAPVELIGRKRGCPRCGRSLVVRRSKPRDAEPVLVLVDGDERCSLAVAYRRGA
jgi:uncharacterized paraquat-inducible protein A